MISREVKLRSEWDAANMEFNRVVALAARFDCDGEHAHQTISDAVWLCRTIMVNAAAVIARNELDCLKAR